MTLRGVLACCALAAGLSRGADARRWPQPALGDAETSEVAVLFTVDDGPNPTTTPAILDILAQRRIRAVFFVVGKQVDSKHKEIPAILERIVREGHILANHTMFHTDLCKAPTEQAVADLDGGREVIERATAMRINWFRAPFGVRCDQLEALLAERNISHFHWDLDPQEWKHGNVKRTVKYVTEELARASGRNVLLLHDIKQVTVEALPQIFAWIDEENEKRAKASQPRIRVLQAPDIAVERLPPALVDWLAEAMAGARELPRTIASVLP